MLLLIIHGSNFIIGGVVTPFTKGTKFEIQICGSLFLPQKLILHF